MYVWKREKVGKKSHKRHRGKESVCVQQSRTGLLNFVLLTTSLQRWVWRASWLPLKLTCVVVLVSAVNRPPGGKVSGRTHVRFSLKSVSNIITYDAPSLKSHLGKWLCFYLHCGLMCLLSVINTDDCIPGEDVWRCMAHLMYSRTPEPTHLHCHPGF